MQEINGGAEHAGAFIMSPQSGVGTSAVLVLGGSEGGDQTARTIGAAMVDAGFTVLGVPYQQPFGHEGAGPFSALPNVFANLPVERVGEAAAWLFAETGITNRRLAIYGFSKGAELALLAASLEGGYAAIVAIAPSDVVWEGWGLGVEPGSASSFAWKRNPLPFVPYEGFAREMARYARGESGARLANAHEQGRALHPRSAELARIKVELCRSPILLAAGGKDLAWPSAAMAENIAASRKKAGLTTDIMIFPECGHVLCGEGNWRHPTSPTGEQDQNARTKIWERSLAFLSTHLEP